MFLIKSLLAVLCLSCCNILVKGSEDDLKVYRPSPKLIGSKRFEHPDDPVLNKLDESLAKISTIYMQALFSGTHSAKLDMDMRKLEIELFDLLDKLYQEKRLKEYMKYESEVTRQMIIYNMLKKLFGYDDSDNEKVT